MIDFNANIHNKFLLQTKKTGHKIRFADSISKCDKLVQKCIKYFRWCVDSEKKDIAIFMIVKGHLVGYLWLHRFNLQGSVQKIGLLKQMLLEIGTICNFILNDRELGKVVDLTSGKQIEDYLLTE